MIINIIDYGMGNLQSVNNALEILNCNSRISNKASDIDNADAIILPGVGSFGQAMDNLESLNLITSLRQAVLDSKKPFLGICLGMQLFADRSEEQGGHRGLSLIPGEVREIPIREKLRLPHIGWNDLQINKSRPLFEGIDDKSAFYFVHSYRFECDDKYVTSKTRYGSDITSSIQSNNIFGVQFHPERSQRKGLHLLDNFIKYVAEQC